MAKKAKQIPVGPSVVIAEAIATFELTQDEVATALGVSRLTVNELVKGRRAITPQTALRFERLFGLDAAQLVTMQMNHDLALCRHNEVFMAEIAKIKPLRKKNG